VLGKPSEQDVNWRGRSVRGGVKLWPIGTDTAKHLLYGRMRLSQPGAGFVHVPLAYKGTDEFEQMTAEKLMPVVINGKNSFRWTNPPGKRNEATDCMVYAYAAACWLGIQQTGPSSWERREAKYAPQEPGLFDAPPPVPMSPEASENMPNQAPAHTESAQTAIKSEAKPAAQQPSRLSHRQPARAVYNPTKW
jgi:phage terminase large subunit GpA-like protein